jgi:zinc transport system permease protein
MNLSEMLAFDFVQRALLAMCLLALLYPLLGVFVVNQRLAYFGDAVAHSAFIGAALAALLGWQTENLLLVLAPLFALLVSWFQARTNLPTDTLLIVAITGVAALGIALMSLREETIPLGALLFGDVLALSNDDLWRLAGINLVGLTALQRLYRPLIRLGFHRELAQVQGVPVRRVEVGFLILLAIAVAVGLKAVGVLPISALLVLPGATARFYSRSFRQMVLVSVLMGGVSLITGFGMALMTPVPPGAAVALIASVLFILSVLVLSGRGRREAAR